MRKTESIVYRHFGAEIFEPERFMAIRNRPCFSKPFGGLWASRVNATRGWQDFCEDQDYELQSLNRHFDFVLHPDANIYTIRTIDDLRQLPMRENPMPATFGMFLPDFEECVRCGIDAIELTWYGEEFAQPGSGPVGGALRTWDCDSIVILNPNVVLTIQETNHRKERCTDCAYLVEGDDGSWVCDDCGKNVTAIPDNECSAEQQW